MKLFIKKIIFILFIFFLITGGCLGYSWYIEHTLHQFLKSKGIFVQTIDYRLLQKEIHFEGLSLTNTTGGYQLRIGKGMVSGVGLAEMKHIREKHYVPIKKVFCNAVNVIYNGQNGSIYTTVQNVTADSLVLYSTDNRKKYNKEGKTSASTFFQEAPLLYSSSIGELTFEALVVRKHTMDTTSFPASEKKLFPSEKKEQSLSSADKSKEGQPTLLVVNSATIKNMRYVDAFPFFGVGYDSAHFLDVSENIVHLSAPLIQSSFSIKNKEVSFSLLAQDLMLPALLYSQISEDMHSLAQANNDEPLVCSFSAFLKSTHDKKHVTIEKSLTSDALFDYSRTEALSLPPSSDVSTLHNDIFLFLSLALLEEMDETVTDNGLFTAIAKALSHEKNDRQSIEKVKNKKANEYESLALGESDSARASCYFALSSLWKKSGQLTLSFIPQKPTPAPVGFGFSFFFPPERGMSATYTQLSNE